MGTFQQIEKIEKKFPRKRYNLAKWPAFYGNSSDEVICVRREKTFYACTLEEQLKEIKSVIF